MDSVQSDKIIKAKEEPMTPTMIEQSAALSLLQQYTYSGSESEEENDDDGKPVQKYRTVTADAGCLTSSSSSSDSSDEELDLNQIRKKLDAAPAVHSDDEENDDDEEGGGGASKVRKKREPLKVKGELLLEDLPPIQDLEIQVDEKECLELGTISSIVDQLVLVEAYSHSAPLDIDSVLFLDKGQRVLGKIFDVIGQVSSPIYCVRFNSHTDIVERKNIAVGEKVFCAPRTEYTSYVILQNIMGKGSDASWKNDVEVPDNMIEYSDDEQERSTRKQSRQKLVGMRRLQNLPPPVQSQQQQQQNFSWHQANMNYNNYSNYSQQPRSNNNNNHF